MLFILFIMTFYFLLLLLFVCVCMCVRSFAIVAKVNFMLKVSLSFYVEEITITTTAAQKTTKKYYKSWQQANNTHIQMYN